MFLTVVPAYGRDYTSVAEVKADWNAGKDFLVADMSRGGYINKEDAEIDGITVNVRYSKKTKLCVIKNKKVG